MFAFSTFVCRSSGERARSPKRRLAQLAIFGTLMTLLASCSAHKLTQQGEDIMSKVYDAYGGRARLSQIKSVAAEGSITALVRGDTGVYRRALRRDGKLYVDIRYTRSRETRILNGTEAVRGVEGKIESVTGPGYLAMVYQYNELSMPFALLDGSFDVADLGQAPLKGKVARVLRCTDGAGNSLDMYIDEYAHRIVKTLGNFTVGDKTTSLSAEYSDFRFVEGVLLPFRIVNYAGSTKISETSIDDYLLNAPLNDAMFAIGAHAHGHPGN